MNLITSGRGTTRVRLLLIALIGALTATALFAAPEGIAKKKKAKAKVTAMTRNVYLGADLNLALSAATLNEAFDGAGEIYNEVERTNFPERAVPLAKEIHKSKADLVGLQEVALWREQIPTDGGSPGTTGLGTDATEVKYDFLQLLRDELKKRGAKYKVVAVQEEFDGELPANVDGSADHSPDLDARLTMRDVILQRKGGKVKAKKSTVKQDHYDTLLMESVAGLVDVTVQRGWQSVEAVYKKKGKKRKKGRRKPTKYKFRFVNTHLESEGNLIREAQAIELTQGPLKTKKPAILVGDLNSGLLDPHMIGDGASGSDEQQLAFKALKQFGMKDYGAVQSCCYGPALDINEDPFDHTVDHVLANKKAKAKLRKSYVTGNDPSEITPSGLWPSDHGGVVSKLKLRK